MKHSPTLLGFCAALLPSGYAGPGLMAEAVENPYQEVDWQSWQTLDSANHFHTDRSDKVRQAAYAIGMRHLPFTDYYPSAPTYPLPDEYLKRNPEAIGSPNSEHHSCTDHGLHFTVPGSWYTTGYGAGGDADLSRSPIEYTFTGLKSSDSSAEIHDSVYRLDLRYEGLEQEPPQVIVTVDGARQIDGGTFQSVGTGEIHERHFGPDTPTLSLQPSGSSVRVRAEFDPRTTRITRLRLMQGTNRPWRTAFGEALDGDAVDARGRPTQGLLYPDGGGIVINHPSDTTSQAYLGMLDFDPRVLGIEVWNHRRQFGLEPEAPHLRFYQHWDAILRTGRRCFGFFSKDHRWQGQGRNVLLVPPVEGLSRSEKERAALRAYRKGQFFGRMGAMALDGSGGVRSPYDQSGFRFKRIAVAEKNGRADSVEVVVGDQDRHIRPQVQIRFITDEGIAQVVDDSQARFVLPRRADGSPGCAYVRIEAYAYPRTHLGGQPLTAEDLGKLDVYQIARLHDRLGMPTDTDVDPPGQAPVPIADLIFSQPIRFTQ